MATCDTCNGAKTIVVPRDRKPERILCPACNGTGKRS
ncbi:DnaJ-class molecular chaperone [Streptomonospora nanhaiensis]|uniref:DnaJ-class molecular chaperone n=1 Tax=Streptomonospora nanhaiensis TaxID=1323731 RepID=A0A853BR23_9ACTN|nr:DnaJ-class molecular chaperone [Streptomonospora nanhaiensis]